MVLYGVLALLYNIIAAPCSGYQKQGALELLRQNITQQTNADLAIFAAQQTTVSLKQALLSSISNNKHIYLKAFQHLATVFQQASEEAKRITAHQ